ncbi:hypothetical protein EIP91_004221 [Steccherinum ochraceum]|uniref:Uncharacterized protein n=1 Tax=Steccherinum ochraceum TaxID=92696 RepID=A0A4R0RA92_9APHY|nr:hypothetical protein EIP91_004221 [Steccherinum ochraceum]
MAYNQMEQRIANYVRPFTAGAVAGVSAVGFVHPLDDIHLSRDGIGSTHVTIAFQAGSCNYNIVFDNSDQACPTWPHLPKTSLNCTVNANGQKMRVPKKRKYVSDSRVPVSSCIALANPFSRRYYGNAFGIV